jgi:hypothetical protein
MPFVVKDRVQVTSTTTGTGTFTLGAASSGFQDFTSMATGSGWDISTAQSLQSFSVAAQENDPQGIFFKPDGLKMYVVGNTGDDVLEYNLATAWDVRTASYLQNFLISAQDATPVGIFFKPDGLKMYFVGQTNDSVFEYNLSSAWNISTATFVQSLSVATLDAVPTGIFFKPDGLKMYIVGSSGDDILEYDLSSAWNISTATYLQNFVISAQDTTPVCIFFRPDGQTMYLVGNTNNSVYQYSLGTAWNITTASYVRAFSVALQETDPAGIFFKPDGSTMYISGAVADAVFQYSLSVNSIYYGITNGTDWEIGIGHLPPDGLELYRDTVLESSNSNALVNWGAGTKNVFCTFPADATEGTVPQGDTSQVGTDLVAWTNLKKELDRTVINGVPYNNNNTAGVVSTYSLVHTSSSAYYGGVLAPNGDIHFIPYNGEVGQKVNYLTGVVSTYAIFLTFNNSKYAGGVLASNGDIHFIPHSASVGQKVNSSGVVSTYSLIYSASGAYWGGVVAPNGDIHFIPYNAPRGQKVSAAGVVSTYSLIYTTTLAYSGGVLAPNGDIHFVPGGAARGQKISAAGVVSTYSLVYTTGGSTLAYSGGVLAPNGDIHFVPWSALVGQKISSSGVVSTYSLVVAVGGAYSGGVLAPNGDIYFVPRDSSTGVGDPYVGQKVSAAGVVNTYGLVLTTSGSFIGGVLAPNGEIYFIPANAARGQKLSTGTQRNIGYALSPFFNKF